MYRDFEYSSLVKKLFGTDLEKTVALGKIPKNERSRVEKEGDACQIPTDAFS